jgi:hypothetical protein
MGPRPRRSFVRLYSAGLLLTLGAAFIAFGDVGEGIFIAVVGAVGLLGGLRRLNPEG